MEILCYTREPLEDIIYAEKLAYSMHLAWREEKGGAFLPFHHNEGLLYARAVQRQDGTLVAKSLRAPWIFEKKGGGFGVIAVRTEADGKTENDSEGCVLLWESADLVRYREIGLVRLQESGHINRAQCVYDEGTGLYRVTWENQDGSRWQAAGGLFPEKETSGSPAAHPGKEEAYLFGSGGRSVPERAESRGQSSPDGVEGISPEELAEIQGCRPGNILTIPEKQGDYLKKKLTVPVCREIALTGDEKGAGRRAVAVYSDGTSVERKVDWDPEGGTGVVHQEHFAFPFAENRADPCCMYWQGRYYFIATNDADGNHTLYIRCADTLEGVQSAPETLLLDSVTHPGIGGLLWAPEFHEIGGRMYIFHAATKGEFFWEESRVMQLRDGGDPMCRQDWSAPKLVVKKDGSPLCEAGKVISLDMTTFEYEGGVYAMWSQRQFLPVDQGAWLYLARIDEREPWKLLSDPVCIAVPEYGWENNHTFVVEGPYALRRDGQLMVTYSGAAVDATYAVGLLKPVMGSDILDPANWRKSNFPLLSSRSADGEFGPGHNSYVTDENGLTWNFYHARPGVDGPRSSCARRVHFDVDGEPMLDLAEAADLPEGMRRISEKRQEG